jgi:hypothetical protein
VVKTALDKEAGRDFYAEPSLLGQITKLISDGANKFSYAMGLLRRLCMPMRIQKVPYLRMVVNSSVEMFVSVVEENTSAAGF